MNKILKLLQNRKLLLIIFIAIFVALIILGFVGPNCNKGEDKLVKIEKGWGSGEVADKLKSEQIINSRWIFILYVWVKGYNHHLQAGEYLLNTKMTIPEISKILTKGETNPNWVKVTIPEGWTNTQIEERLVSSDVIKSGEKLPQDKEGYLFPDTYYFYKNISISDVVKKMEDNFDGKLKEILSAEAQEKLGEGGLYDILKMASIVEKEVISDEDRAIVAGIFWKRIKNNVPLQADITIAYILGVDKWRYSYEDTRIKSPYNTYLNLGLPPTPIDNPGLSAIKAAIYPKQTDYLYFLSAPDGRTIYAKTLEEHNANKAKYLK